MSIYEEAYEQKKAFLVRTIALNSAIGNIKAVSRAEEDLKQIEEDKILHDKKERSRLMHEAMRCTPR